VQRRRLNVQYETCDSLTCKEGNRVINVKLESAVNTIETSIMLKMAHYSAVGRNGAGLYSGKALFIVFRRYRISAVAGLLAATKFSSLPSGQYREGTVPEHRLLPTFYISLDNLKCLCYVVFLFFSDPMLTQEQGRVV